MKTRSPKERRIQDRERMKGKARRVQPWVPDAKNADHLAKCSCWLCKNEGVAKFKKRKADLIYED